ncbi:MAG: SET domain-containing protein [Nanoarchaeota archaeon]
MKKDFLIKDTAGCGKGVFSRKPFKKDQIMFVFGRKIVPWTKANHRSIQLAKNRWLNPTEEDLGFFLNHSCHPNARFLAPHFIAALSDIKPGEEITIDYSSVINIPRWDMECGCGNRGCRKMVKSYSKSPKKIKEKYKGMTSFGV